MSWIIGALVLVGAVLTLVWYLNRAEFADLFEATPRLTRSAPKAATNVAAPRAAPAIDLAQSTGKAFHLSDLKGNAVVVHFWASWCPPCLGEIPQWLEFAARWKGRPVRFVAVSLDQAWPEALKILPDSRLPENTVSVLDTTQKLPDLFGTYQYPETYLLDSELRIVSKWVGAQDWGSAPIAQAMESVIPGQTPSH